MAISDIYTGANGTLQFVELDTPEGAGGKAVMDGYSLTAVGRVTGVEIHVDTDLEEFHEIGRRHASSLHPGNIHIRGKVDRAYVNGALLYLLLGRGASPETQAEPYVQPELAMNVALDDPADPTVRSIVDLYGVKFENWAFSLPEDDFVMENATFKALRVNVREEGDEAAGIPAFE